MKLMTKLHRVLVHKPVSVDYKGRQGKQQRQQSASRLLRAGFLLQLEKIHPTLVLQFSTSAT